MLYFLARYLFYQTSQITWQIKIFYYYNSSGGFEVDRKNSSKNVYMSSHIKIDTDLEDVYKYRIEITLSTAINFFLVMIISVFLIAHWAEFVICCLVILRVNFYLAVKEY